MTTQRAEETKAIRKALAAAGIVARVEHGKGTAWGWLRINVGNGNSHLDARVTEAVRSTGRTGYSLEQVNVLSQSRWDEKAKKSVPILQPDQRAGVAPGEVVEDVRGSELRAGDVVLLDHDEVRLEVQTATSDGNWTHLQDPAGRRRSYSSLDHVRVVRAPLSRVYEVPGRETSAGLTAGILGTISGTSGPTEAGSDHDTTATGEPMRITNDTTTPNNAAPATGAKLPSVGGRKKKDEKKDSGKPEEQKDAAAAKPKEEPVEKKDADVQKDAGAADGKGTETRAPSSRGVAHRAAGGLTRSRTFLTHQADRIARWTNNPAAAKVAEAIRDSCGNLSEAIDELNKFPADFVPPSTPNALGDGAQVELKEKAFAEFADLFPADTSRVLTVDKVLAGGKLRCKTATGTVLVLNRAQVNPVADKKADKKGEK